MAVFLLGFGLLATAGRGAEARPDRFRLGSASGTEWLPARTEAALARRLELLGARVVGPAEPAQLWSGEVPGRRLELVVEPPTVDRAEARVRIEARVDQGPALRAEGAADRLDDLLSTLAVGLLGKTPEARLPLHDLALPFSVHRLLGRAAVRERSERLVQARILYERAIDRGPGALSVEALLGARRVRRGEPAPTLVRASLERLTDARRRGNARNALGAALDAVRYGAKPRLRWSLELPVRGREAWRDDRRIWVAGPGRWVAVDAASGSVGSVGDRPERPFGSAQDDLLARVGPRLLRMARDGRARWATPLPSGLREGARTAGAGQIAVFGPDGLGWVEASLGALGPVARGATPLAVDEGGALALIGDLRRVQLYRPGRDAAAWTATVSVPIRAASLTPTRALVFAGDELHLFDAHDGRRKAAPIRLSPRSQLLAVHGRHAAVGLGGSRVAFVDVLAGAVTAEVQGPGRPIGAHVGGFVIAVAFATGDLVHWDPDGLYLDRARVEGRPVRVFRGAPAAPGPVVETDEVLYAFAELTPGGRFDVDILLEAAEAAEGGDRARDARVLATHVARAGSGRIGRAERIRARLLEASGRPEAARAARRRARRVEDPTLSVPPFVLR